MTCRSCGAANPAGAKFCVECGAPQSSVCPACGAPASAGQKFCAQCGQRLGAEDEAAPRPTSAATVGSTASGAGQATPAAERRLVTVLFADLVGFTGLAEGRDPEQVRDLLGRYFDLSSEIARRYGGTVEKFIGDAVMAVWGTPVAHEDDAERAVRAALELVDAVAQLGREVGLDGLRARAGLLSGEAAVNLAAADQGMVAGDLVNTASRLQGAARPGTVLVGEATMQAASRAIAFEPAGEHDLKGKAAPVAAWRAVRVFGEVGGRGRTDALEPPFVGRETEFRLLRELFLTTGRDRRARLVSMTGQAGIGKSRLAWEFNKYVDGLADTVYWHTGRSPSYGEGVAFWALGEMVRKRAQLAESDDEATTRSRVAEMLVRWIPDAEERALVEAGVLALLGVGEAPAGGRPALFAAWRTLFERMAEQAPVALVFEDLHWADDGLLDFIEHLLEWSRNHPIYVVTLARPELLDRRPTWGSGQRNGTALPLTPLSESEMLELLTGLVPGLPEPAIRTILARADGIPLYAVETIRMLVADGRLVSDDNGRYRPVRDLGSLDVPSSLRGLIAARLDALPAELRALVADGAVLGKTFAPPALAAVSGLDQADLEPRLRELDRLEILELDTDPRSPERGQYGFVQSLIREVAYSTLSKRDRRTKHLAAARYFEGLGEDELAGALATHYYAAWEAIPDGAEGAAVAVQARIALRAAGERAEALGAVTQAITHFDQARAIPGSSPTDEAWLLERAGQCARLAGDYELSEERYAGAVAIRRTLGVPDSLAGAIAGLAAARASRGLVSEALAIAADGLAEVGEADGPGALALLDRMSNSLSADARIEESLVYAERQLQMAERLRDHQGVIDGVSNRVNVLIGSGRLLEASVLLDGLVPLVAESGLPRQQVNLTHLRGLLGGAENPAHAIAVAKEGAVEARRLGSRRDLVIIVLNGGESAFHTGDWAWARREYRSVLGLALSGVDQLLLVANARVLDVLTGHRDDELEAMAAEVLQAPDEGGLRTFKWDLEFWPAFVAGDYRRCVELDRLIIGTDPLNAPTAYQWAIRSAAWMLDAVLARSLFNEFVGVGRRSSVLDALRLGMEANALAAEGRAADAEPLYRAAIARLDALGCRFDLAQAALDAAVILGTGTPFGREMADVARPILEQLEARPLLDRLAAMEAGAAGAATSR
jgi:class 3 adenylate cyclase/tetratricopeptide (TPR) repeat protein